MMMSGLGVKKKDESEANIKKSARELFLSQGYSETTMAEIAAKAEIDVSTLDNYFRSKDELFIAVMSEEFVFSQEDIEQLEDDIEEDVIEILLKFMWKSCKSLKLVEKKIWRDLIATILGNTNFNNFLFKGLIKIDYKFIDKLKLLLENIKSKGLLLPEFNGDEAGNVIYSIIMTQFILYVYIEDTTFKVFANNVENQIRFIFEGNYPSLNK